jgi:hypothetical protein
MSDGEGSRADRLRDRRSGRAQSQPDETGERDEPSKLSKPSETDETANRSETDKTDEQTVKDEHIGTYMYLPRQQKKEVGRLYNVLKAEYEYEYDTEFEKNRHFYPLLIQHGLDGLERLEASEIQDRLDEF